ncbi:hypothetical protein DAI22_08g237900 [Oryza sativa Japonica Group]|nr:hypothetical protein DAI22_08g237900 [Oryza sativa Japonica Group]
MASMEQNKLSCAVIMSLVPAEKMGQRIISTCNRVHYSIAEVLLLLHHSTHN